MKVNTDTFCSQCSSFTAVVHIPVMITFRTAICKDCLEEALQLLKEKEKNDN